MREKGHNNHLMCLKIINLSVQVTTTNSWTSVKSSQAAVLPLLLCLIPQVNVFYSVTPDLYLHIGFAISILLTRHCIYLPFNSSLHLGFPESLFSFPLSVFLSSTTSLYVPRGKCRPKREYACPVSFQYNIRCPVNHATSRRSPLHEQISIKIQNPSALLFMCSVIFHT